MLMVERVRIAIEQAFLRQRITAGAWGQGWGHVIPPIDMNEIARAAIEAMREPTVAMLGATTAIYDAMPEDDVVRRHEPLPDHVIWRAMIDAALKE